MKVLQVEVLSAQQSKLARLSSVCLGTASAAVRQVRRLSSNRFAGLFLAMFLAFAVSAHADGSSNGQTAVTSLGLLSSLGVDFGAVATSLVLIIGLALAACIPLVMMMIGLMIGLRFFHISPRKAG